MLSDGIIGEVAVRTPTPKELFSYGEVLRSELDEFLDDETMSHRITIVSDRGSGMVQIELVRAGSGGVHSYPAEAASARAFEKMREQMARPPGQWLYFERNLFLYRGEHTFIFKPMQLIWWTHSQALLDADEFISTAVAPLR